MHGFSAVFYKWNHVGIFCVCVCLISFADYDRYICLWICHELVVCSCLLVLSIALYGYTAVILTFGDRYLSYLKFGAIGINKSYCCQPIFLVHMCLYFCWHITHGVQLLGASPVEWMLIGQMSKVASLIHTSW